MTTKNLVIVESPAKAKTIEKFLGKDFCVKSSIGHIRDIAKKNGIDTKNNFKPLYVVDDAKKKIVKELKALSKKAKKVYLATDGDREGEAIAWHLLEALNLPENTPRIIFNEITKQAVSNAIIEAKTINKNLVNSQQARRIIDRLLGFEISPILWNKLSGVRSAGRVQSPVVRLVVEREREISSHVAKITFKTSAKLINNNKITDVKLNKDFNNKEQVLSFCKELLKSKLIVSSITKKPIKKSPSPPFTTSTLQQKASQKLGFSVQKTMSLAQSLYHDGLITYIRTDSLNMSSIAIQQAEKVITEKYGKKYHKTRVYKNKNTNAQEAHEAIRPTDITKTNTPTNIDSQAKKLYKLIYNQTLASQMSDAELQKTQIIIDIENRDEKFLANGEVLLFDGFLTVYDTNKKDKLLTNLNQNEELKIDSLSSRESFSKHNPRYTDSSLIKTIEDMGIGRPSTFASMVSKVQEREYVVKKNNDGYERKFQLVEIKNNQIIESTAKEITDAEKNKLFPTNTAYLLNDFLVKYFDNIIDYKFTAKLENDFDDIANENISWQKIVENFYKAFRKQVENTTNVSREEANKETKLGIDPKSGKTVSIGLGRYGVFVKLSGKNKDEKPSFAPLRESMNIETITLDEALELFNMPRIVGETEEFGTIKANYGRFGPYVQYNKGYVSLKEVIPESVTLEQALILIKEKEKSDAQRIIKSFKDSEIKILKGRFGAYISNGKKRGKGQKNISIKKVFGDKNPEELTLKECKEELDKISKKK
jgi:DNA topoisomerase-1